MPDKPMWLGRLDESIAALERVDSLWIDTGTLQSLLGISRRRAQQILKPLVKQIIGKNGLAKKADVVGYLRQLAAGDARRYESQRRERLRSLLDDLHRELKTQPRVVVASPISVVNQRFEGLPAGVQLSPGRILIEGFSTAEDALQRLLELGMAIGNDMAGFEDRVAKRMAATRLSC